VRDAEGLPAEAMQAIAREFNLPETVFLQPAGDAGHRAKLRIFTPARELPFAGHPTVGTAVLLRHLDGGAGERELVLEENIGAIACTATAGERSGSARFIIPREPQQLGDVEDAGAAAAALGLTLDDLGCEDFQPGHWTAGNPFTFLPVRGLDAVVRSRPDPAAWDRAFGPDEPGAVYVFCRETVDGHDFHARMFAPRLGVAEDPATGSAAAAFAGLIARFGKLADGRHDIAIEQGYEMHRPSLIRVSLTMRGKNLHSTSIGGDAVLISEGTIEA
jgi:trans-2,3-dihydro-3-hydroxyanthranilate isomerase